MTRYLLLPALLLSFSFVSCAVLDQKQVQSLRDHRVSEATVSKMQREETLLPAEIIELTRRGVSQDQIYKYIRRTGVNFLVTKQDSVRMHEAGVSPQVIDLVAQESAKFAADYAVMHGGDSSGVPPTGPLLLQSSSTPFVY